MCVLSSFNCFAVFSQNEDTNASVDPQLNLYSSQNKVPVLKWVCGWGWTHSTVYKYVFIRLLLYTGPTTFVLFIFQVLANTKRLCSRLKLAGFEIVTGDTDIHLVLVDVRPFGLTGAKAEFILEEVSIACNKNTGKMILSLKNVGKKVTYLYIKSSSCNNI